MEDAAVDARAKLGEGTGRWVGIGRKDRGRDTSWKVAERGWRSIEVGTRRRIVEVGARLRERVGP